MVTGLPNYPGGKYFPGYRLLCGPWREEWNGIQIIRIPLLSRGRSRLRLALNYVSFAIAGALLVPLRLKGKYDIVFCWMPSPITQTIPAIVASRYHQTPFILWVLDLWPDSITASGMARNARLVALAGALTRWVYRQCDLIIGSSRRFEAHITAVAQVDQLRFRYLPQWEVPVVQRTCPKMPALPSGFRVMFTGNIGFSQDFPTIMAAAGLLRDSRDICWIIVGEGQALPMVRAEIAARNLQDRFYLAGLQPLEAMPTFYEAADVLLATLQPAEIFSRTIPTKVQSYLAAGKPLVTAIGGEVEDIMRESGAGLTVPSGDPQALAEAILRLADMTPEERLCMGRNGQRYSSQHFDRERLLDQLSSWISDEAAGRTRLPMTEGPPLI
jgi:glycosyltransferase involved in cell wall biosynthesis